MSLDIFGACPDCKASWDGGNIPIEHRAMYKPPYKWSRTIGIYSRETDRTIAFKCPDCGKEFQR